MDDIGPAEPWVSVEQIARHLGVGKESVYRWVDTRALPAHRVGRLLRFRISEVDAWVRGDRGPRATDSHSVEIQSTIQEMVRRIVERFDPERIILFGSHARGDAGPDSDVDLLVVMDFEGSKREQQVEIRLALHDVRVSKDIVLATPDEVERYRGIVGTIIRPALREGRVLYQRAA